MAWRRTGKYNNQKTTVFGESLDSKKEALHYLLLLERLKRGEITELARQVSFELQPAFTKAKKKYRPIMYIADFVITHKDGTKEVIDVKGYAKEKVWLIKKKLFEFKFPMSITVV